MLGDEFQDQRLRSRPGQGVPGGCHRPGFQIGKIGRERPQRVGAGPGACEVLERCDVVVCQQFGKLVAPVERQNRIERIQLFGAG